MPKAARKKGHFMPGVKGGKDKGTLPIYRMVAQSKGNSLPAIEIIKKGKNVWTYSILKRLTGGTDDIPGIRLFCFDDLIRDISDQQQIEKVKLKEKLKGSYGYLFPQWNWKKVKIRPIDKNTLIFNQDDDDNNHHHIKLYDYNYNKNIVIVKLYPYKKDDKKKVHMTFRFTLSEVTNSYPWEIKNIIAWAMKLPRSCFPEGSPIRKWIKSNYMSLNIPLIPERKEGRLYFRTLSRESYYTDGCERAYLRLTLNEAGKRLVQSCEEMIYNSTNNNNNSNTPLSKINKEKDKLKLKISNIGKSTQYNYLSMTIKGLLDYAVKESDYEEFKKTVTNLTESDKYDEIIREGYECDDLGFPELQIQIPVTNYLFKYKIKGYFPFLSHYDTLEKSLPRRFVLRLLRRIASKVKKYSLDMMPQGLRYIVTKMFYDEIKGWISRSGWNNNNTTTDNDDRVKTGLNDYLSEIGEYIGHIEERESVEQKNARIYAMIEKRCREFYKEVYTTIENNKDKEGIIPIYEQIKKARLPWPRTSKILTSINDKYRNRFIITDTCLIARSKAKMLKSLLRSEPTCEQAFTSLIDSGVPKICIDFNWTNFLPKMGFCTRFDSSSNVARVVKLKELKRVKNPLIFQ
jgi:hypothetical protein